MTSSLPGRSFSLCHWPGGSAPPMLFLGEYSKVGAEEKSRCEESTILLTRLFRNQPLDWNVLLQVSGRFV
jgi:hypothetical protein